MKIIPEFGRAVTEELDRRGLYSNRRAGIATGLDHVTILKMKSGQITRYETVMQFAQRLGLDVDQWLKLAGYDPLPETPNARFGRGIRELAREFKRPVPVDQFEGGENWTMEEVESVLAALRKRLEKGEI